MVDQNDNTIEQDKSLLNEIDFFKTTHTIVNNKKGSLGNKKSKSMQTKETTTETERQVLDEEEEEEEELFTSQEEVSIHAMLRLVRPPITNK